MAERAISGDDTPKSLVSVSLPSLAGSKRLTAAKPDKAPHRGRRMTRESLVAHNISAFKFLCTIIS